MTNMQDVVMAAEAYRRRVFFNYERRLRLRSPPEKVPFPPCPVQCIVSRSIFDSLKNMAPEIFVFALCVNPLVQKAHDDMELGLQVFEYFSSVKQEHGHTFMTAADLMRAVVPVFPPTGSHVVREGYLGGERPPGELRCPPSKFFMLFDTDGDGLISFPE